MGSDVRRRVSRMVFRISTKGVLGGEGGVRRWQEYLPARGEVSQGGGGGRWDGVVGVVGVDCWLWCGFGGVFCLVVWEGGLGS